MTSISSLWIKTHAPKGKIFVLSSNSSLVENLSCIEVDRSTTDRFVLQILKKENGWYVLSTIKILSPIIFLSFHFIIVIPFQCHFWQGNCFWHRHAHPDSQNADLRDFSQQENEKGYERKRTVLANLFCILFMLKTLLFLDPFQNLQRS